LLTGIRAALDRIASSRAQLEARTGELRERVAMLDSRAEESIAGGRPDLARHTLERRRIATAELVLLEERLQAADLEAARLELVDRRLAAQIEAVLTHEATVEARQQAAAARVQINETLAGISDGIATLRPGLLEAEEEAEALEARAEALERLLAAESDLLHE
jgi:phage shock protein A